MFKKYEVVVMVKGGLFGVVEKPLWFGKSRVQVHLLDTIFFKDIQNTLLYRANKGNVIAYLLREWNYDPGRAILLATRNNVVEQFIMRIQNTHQVEMVKQSMLKIVLAVRSGEVDKKDIKNFFLVFNTLTQSAADIYAALHTDDEAKQAHLGLTEVNE